MEVDKLFYREIWGHDKLMLCFMDVAGLEFGKLRKNKNYVISRKESLRAANSLIVLVAKGSKMKLSHFVSEETWCYKLSGLNYSNRAVTIHLDYYLQLQINDLHFSRPTGSPLE